MNDGVRKVLHVVGQIFIAGVVLGMTLLSLPALMAAGALIAVGYPLLVGILLLGLAISFVFRVKDYPKYSWLGQLLYVFWFPALVVAVTAPIRVIGVAVQSNPHFGWFDVAVGVIGISVVTFLTILDAGWRRGQLEQLESLPTSKVRSAAIGLAEFRGTVSRTAVPPALIPPGPSNRLAPFFLEDGTGRILVDPRAAGARGLLAGSFAGRTCEAVIDFLGPERPVYVIGSVQRNPLAPPDATGPDALIVAPLHEPVAAGFFRQLLFVRRDVGPGPQRDIQHVFFLSDATEEKARRHIRMGIMQITALAAVWIASCAWMILTQYPKTRGMEHWSVQEVTEFAGEAAPAELVRRADKGSVRERLQVVEAIQSKDVHTPAAFLALARGLQDPSPELRLASAEALMGTTDQESGREGFWKPERPLLLASAEAGLGEPHPRIRKAALRVLRLALPAPEALPLLIRAGDDPDVEVRLWALSAFKPLGPKAGAAVPLLLRRLDDPERGLREVVRAALPGMFSGADGLPLFRDLLKHEQPEIRRMALIGLAKRAPEDKGVMPDLVASLVDPHFEVRAEAAVGLGLFGPAAVPFEGQLVLLMSDPSTHVQGTAVQALTKVSPNLWTHAATFAALLSSDSWWVRRVAGNALISLGSAADPAVPIMLEALDRGTEGAQGEILRFFHELWQERGAGCVGPAGALAVPALLKIHEGSSSTLKRNSWPVLILLGEDAAPVVPALIPLLADSSLREYTLETLAKLGPVAQAAVPALVDLLPTWKPSTVAWTLAGIVPRDPVQIARLVEGLKHPSSSEIVRACAQVLAACGADAAPAVPALAEQLVKGNDDRISDALVAIGAASVPAMIDALQHPDLKVRWRATQTLGRIGPAARPAAAALTKGLQDPESSVREKAADALTRIDPETALPALLPLLRQRELSVRRDAIQGLSKLGASRLASALPELIEALNERDLEHTAAWILGELGESAWPALPALIAAQKRGNTGSPGEAVLKILKLPPYRISVEEVARRFIDALDPADEVGLARLNELIDLNIPGALDRALSRVAYGKGAGPQARVILLRGMSEKSVWARIKAMEGLARVGPGAPEALAALRAELSFGENPGKLSALRTLRSFGPAAAGALPEMHALLKDSWLQLATEAAETLGRLGPAAREADGELAIAARSKSSELRDAAEVARARIAVPMSEPLERIGRTHPRSDAAMELYRELAGHGDPVVREKAILAWGWRLPASGELADLIVALDDPDANVRAAAAELLHERGGAEPLLVPLLRDESPRVRLKAAQGVGDSRPAALEAIPELIAMLSEPGRELRGAAARALGTAGLEARAAVPELLRAAEAGIGAAVPALGDIGPDSAPAVPFLIEQVQRTFHNTSEIRALGRIGPRAVAAVPLLIQGLSDSSIWSRMPCAEALGGIGEGAASAAPALIAAGRNRREQDLPAIAARALSRLGPTVVPLLIEAFKRGNACAADALGAMGSGAADAVPALREALRGEDLILRFLAIRALRGIGPAAKAAVPDLLRFTRAQSNIRYEASAALESIQSTGR